MSDLMNQKDLKTNLKRKNTNQLKKMNQNKFQNYSKTH